MADGATTPAVTLVKTDDGYAVATWSGALNGLATGVKASMGSVRGLSVQVDGTFGSATAVLQGSNDGTNFVTCRLARQVAAAGVNDAASFTAAGAGRVLDDMFRYYRLSTSGGTSTAVVMTLVGLRA
jgi:hypothetical protein